MQKQYSSNRKFILTFSAFLVLSLTSLLAPSFSQALDASITDDVLSIPVVAIGDLFFSVDLVIIADTDPAELELVNAIELGGAVSIP